MSVVSVVIDDEFRKQIPPLAPEELGQLEQSILAEGCRDALIIWRQPDGTCVLVDGHNRFDICERHKLDFPSVEKEFPSREAAADWIDANQLGRRNLTPDAFRLLLGRRYNRTKKPVGAPKGNKNRAAENQCVQIDHIDSGEPEVANVRTAEKLAESHGVSEATVRRAGKFAEAIEKAPELAKAITQGKSVAVAKRELKAKEEPKPEPEPVKSGCINLTQTHKDIDKGLKLVINGFDTLAGTNPNRQMHMKCVAAYQSLFNVWDDWKKASR